LSWVAISDGRRPVVIPEIAPDIVAPLMPSGTLIAEVQFNVESGARQIVAQLDRNVQWRRRFRMSLGETGDLLVEHRQGDTITNSVIRFPRPDREATLRITMSWHAPNRVGLVTVENLDSMESGQAAFEEPHPWPLDDIAALVGQTAGCGVDPSVTLLAFSDKVEPIGLTSGFAAGTVVDTMNGPCRVERLRPGDLVQTSDHGMQPVRCLATHEVPAFGRFAPVDLRAPFFGLEKDLTVAPDHRLLISGVDAEYLFGSDSVLVEARHLAKMGAYPRRMRPTTIRYFQVLLDAHVCLSVAGAWGESLFLGDLADNPARHAISPLAGIPVKDLPKHTEIASPELRSYEAMVLVSALCA